MKFNQELITKARKGEIAILNDGTKEELCEVLSVCCPQYQGNPSGTAYKYEVRNGKWFAIGIPSDSEIPAHSVKHFFMPDTKTIKGSEGGNEYIQINGGVDAEPENGEAYVGKPRTYKVTRQQMKQIWEALPVQYKDHALNYMATKFPLFDDEKEIDQYWIAGIVESYPSEIIEPIAKRNWPQYFFIPEGEPVLVRDIDNGPDWCIRISDGSGKAFDNGALHGSSKLWQQIIPFTKNPPK